MKLLNSLFDIVDTREEVSGFTSTVKLKPDHIIFKGHFPGHPVTPGVVFLQLVHELLEHYSGKRFRLVEVSTCKFLKVVNPEQEGEVQVFVSLVYKNEHLEIKALGKSNVGAVFKLEADYRMFLT